MVPKYTWWMRLADLWFDVRHPVIAFQRWVTIRYLCNNNLDPVQSNRSAWL